MKSLRRSFWIAVNSARCGLRAILYRREREFIGRLSLYAPNTSGYVDGLEKTIFNLTLLSANQVFPILKSLSEVSGARSPECLSAEEFCKLFNAHNESLKLKEVFDSYGCDKAGNHNYHLVYAAVLTDLVPVQTMLEIGLGTTNTDVVSNMGYSWTPGNSLRAFREYLPDASIIGADVDERVLFQEEMITTHHVDQTDTATLQSLAKSIPGELDLVIDDGLHAPNANLATLVFALGKVRKGGWIVIEDIGEVSRDLWKIIPPLLPTSALCYLITCRSGFVFAVKK